MAETPPITAAAPEGPLGAGIPPIAGVEGDQLRPKILDMLEAKRRLPAPPAHTPLGHHPRTARTPRGLPSPALPAVTTRSLQDALSITEQEVSAYLPTEVDIQVGEALVSGASTMVGIQGYCGIERNRIKATLNNPVAMAWISRQVEALFKTRVAIVDAAVYLRAAGGDTTAAKLFYERFKLLTSQSVRVDHVYSGGVNISALPDDELARIVREKTRLLPAEFRLLEGPSGEKSGSSDVPKAL